MSLEKLYKLKLRIASSYLGLVLQRPDDSEYSGLLERGR